MNMRMSKRDKHILRYKRLELDLVCTSSGEADFNQYKKQCPLTMRAILKYKGLWFRVEPRMSLMPLKSFH